MKTTFASLLSLLALAGCGKSDQQANKTVDNDPFVGCYAGQDGKIDTKVQKSGDTYTVLGLKNGQWKVYGEGGKSGPTSMRRLQGDAIKKELTEAFGEAANEIVDALVNVQNKADAPAVFKVKPSAVGPDKFPSEYMMVTWGPFPVFQKPCN